MKLKNFFCAGLMAATIFCAPIFCSAAESANDKLIKIEQDTYGEEQTGAILNRLSRIEKDFTGKNMQGNMNARIEAVFSSLYENTGEPSVIAKLNALEWNINQQVEVGGIDKRLSALEEKILGNKQTGSFNSRLRALSKASFGTENIPLTQMQIPANTLIKITLIDSATSQTLHVGDILQFQVAEDVIIGDNLVFAKGLRGVGTVANVRRARGWTATNGKLEVDFNSLRTLDGQNIETFVGEESKQQMIDNHMTAGASLVALNLNDRLNKILVHGKNVDVAAGTELYIQTKNNSAIYVLPASGGILQPVFEDEDDNFYDDNLDEEE